MTSSFLRIEWNKRDDFYDSRRGRSDRSRLHKGAKGVRSRSRGVQVRQGGSRCPRADLSQGPLSRRGTDLSGGAGVSAPPGADAIAGKADQEAGEQCVSLLLRVTTPLSCLGHPTTGPG